MQFYLQFKEKVKKVLFSTGHRKIAALALFGLLVLFGAWQLEKVFVLAGGARLYFSPSSGSYNEGKTFTVNVLLDSGGGVGVNAADGTISFDPNYLSVSSVTKDGSIFNLWTSDPSFSNSKGTVTFSGGNPSAYSDSGGAVIKIVFKALKSGSANVSFSAATALAADGKGTNVLSDTGKGSFTVNSAASAPPPAAPPPAPDTTGPAPEGSVGGFDSGINITSPSHADPAKWYAAKNAVFNWKLSPDLSDVSTIINKSATSNPAKISEGSIESKEFDGLDDGTWFFHIRFKNQSGSWSKTIHRQVLVDSSAPDHFTAQVDMSDKNAPPKITFDASDKTSGIDHYEVKLDEKDPLSIFDNQLASSTYTMQPTLPGSHKLGLRAVDKAGNAATLAQELVIPGIGMPEIRMSPGTIQEGEPIVLEGVADWNAVVSVRVAENGKTLSEETVKSDEDGKWTYVDRKHVPTGDYEITAKMTTKAGAESPYTEKTLLSVTGAPFMDKYGLILLMFFVFVVAGVAAYMFYERREYSRRKSVIKRETDEMRDKTEAIFSALHEEIEEKIKLLDPANAEKLGVKPLDANDMMEKFKEALDISHDTLTKEVEDIEKALNE